MVVGFITTYAISASPPPPSPERCEFEPRSGEVKSIQHYVIQLTDLR
jgi:hypothetical protein